MKKVTLRDMKNALKIDIRKAMRRAMKRHMRRDVKTGMRRVLKRGDIVKFLNHGFLQAGGAPHAE